MIQEAHYDTCTEHVDTLEHSMLDACYACAPWWNTYPLCPVHETKLKHCPTNERKAYCQRCKKHYTIKALYDTEERMIQNKCLQEFAISNKKTLIESIELQIKQLSERLKVEHKELSRLKKEAR